MRVAIAQINTQAGNFDATFEIMRTYAVHAQERGADFIVYPAPTLMGANPGALLNNQAYVAEALDMLGRLAKAIDIDAFVPIMEEPLGTFVKNGRVGEPLTSLVMDIVYLHEGKVSRSASFEGFDLSHFDDTTIGFACTPEEFASYASGVDGPDVLIYIPAEGLDIDNEQTALLPRAFTGAVSNMGGTWLVAANAAGAYENYIYAGNSFVMAPSGELAGVAPAFSEDLLVADIDINSHDVLGVAAQEPEYQRERMLWDALAVSVRDQVVKRGLAGALVALDGTLASSIVATVATDALGPMRVSAVICAEAECLASARQLASNLHIHAVDELSFQDMKRLASELDGDAEQEQLVASLLNARVASTASAAELLVLSCADKTELALEPSPSLVIPGAFAPFGDVFRSDVLSLAAWRNTISQVLAPEILERSWPVAGLGIEQVVEGRELAINTVDAALLFYFHRNASYEQLLSLGQGETFVKALLARLHEARVARSLAPSCPLLSDYSLDGTEAPLTDAWIDRGIAHPLPRKVEHFTPLDPVELEALQAQLASDSEDIPWGEGDIDESDIQSHISEFLSFLQEMSQAGSLAKGPNLGEGDEPSSWINGFFSDN